MRRSREGGGPVPGGGQSQGTDPSRQRCLSSSSSSTGCAATAVTNNTGKTSEEIWLMVEMCQKYFRHPLHGHSFARFTTLRPRVCHTCEGPIWGPFSHACQCLTCGLVIHRQCAMKITKVPCGKFRGLFDPDGSKSRVRRVRKGSPTRAATTSSSRNDQSDDGTGHNHPHHHLSIQTSGDPPSSLDTKGEQQLEGADDEDARRRRADKDRSTSIASSQGSVEDGSTISGTTPSASPTSARRITYDAMAVVGALVGGFVGGPTGAFTAMKFGATATGTFKAAGALAGAYTGFKRTQAGDEVQSSQHDSHLPSPIARAWSRLAHRIQDQQPPSSLPFLQIQDFVKELAASDEDDDSAAAAAGGGEGEGTSVGEQRPLKLTPPPRGCQDTNLIKEVLACQGTPPGYLWSVLLRHFQRRHPSETWQEGLEEEKDGNGKEGDDEDLQDDEMKAISSSCCQDASAIVHEVALVLLDYIPGLLSSVETCDEAVETAEAAIMATLHPAAILECQTQVADLCLTMEKWYQDQGSGTMEEEEDDDAAGSALSPPSAQQQYHEEDGKAEEEGRGGPMSTAAKDIMEKEEGERKKKKNHNDEEEDHQSGGLQEKGKKHKSKRQAKQSRRHHHAPHRLSSNERRRVEKAAKELCDIANEVTSLRKVRQIMLTCMALGGGNMEMTADELLPLLGHTIKVATLPTLPAQLTFIDAMCDTGSLLGAEGYALTSLQVVLSLILDGRGGEVTPERLASPSPPPTM